MDQYVRAELRTWLDEELARRKALADANAGLGVNAIDDNVAVDSATALDRGARNKRTRRNDVDSGSDGDDDDIHQAIRSRGRATAGTSRSTAQAGGSRSAKESDFVQQAIRLVTSSRTVEKQLADMQDKLDTEVASRVEAEEKITDMQDKLDTEVASRVEAKEKIKKVEATQAERDGEKDKAEGKIKDMEKAMKAAQNERDDLKTKAAGLQERLDGQVARATQQVQELSQIKKEAALVGGKVAGLEKDLAEEKADHAKTTSQLVKWKATFAALQGP
jgi:chromosome segregation ATPase